ncbi:MAG TPA: rod shape-determining protein MreD [Solirubrobacteraceae bacterium]|nr:rod shape-determining protein MreD [Solirubrobacteraceae bacterium]
MTDGTRLKLAARLVPLGVLTVIVQVAAVSQVHLFGVNADLLPLVVAAVGLLCGSLTGATFGFAVGLFLDLALVQTVGLSSLLYVAVGYWAGRARELRDPQGPLVPIVLGALATAVATIGYSLMQFLLGVDAPVTFVLVREIVATILLNALIAAPVMGLVRRILGPALPEDPRRRRRRRAYTTGGLSPLQRA